MSAALEPPKHRAPHRVPPGLLPPADFPNAAGTAEIEAGLAADAERSTRAASVRAIRLLRGSFSRSPDLDEAGRFADRASFASDRALRAAARAEDAARELPPSDPRSKRCRNAAERAQAASNRAADLARETRQAVQEASVGPA